MWMRPEIEVPEAMRCCLPRSRRRSAMTSTQCIGARAPPKKGPPWRRSLKRARPDEPAQRDAPNGVERRLVHNDDAKQRGPAGLLDRVDRVLHRLAGPEHIVDHDDL